MWCEGIQEVERQMRCHPQANSMVFQAFFNKCDARDELLAPGAKGGHGGGSNTATGRIRASAGAKTPKPSCGRRKLGSAAQRENWECCVCFEECSQEQRVVLFPCRHRCLCYNCSQKMLTQPGQLSKCPICKQRVIDFKTMGELDRQYIDC